MRKGGEGGREDGENEEVKVKVKVKAKVKFSLERTMKAQRGSRGVALLFL
jgi:hypothetical protein